MNKKKIIALLCAFAMILGLVGCGNKITPNDETDSKQETPIESESKIDSSTETEDEEGLIYEDDYIKVICLEELIIEIKTDSTYEWSYLEDIAEVKLDNNKYVFTPLKEGNITFEFLSEESSYEIELNVYEDMTIFASIYDNSGVPGGMEQIDIEDKDIEEMFNNIYSTIPENMMPPALMTTKVDINVTDTMSYNFGVEELDGLEVAYLSEPMIMPVAYSLSIMRFENADKAAEAAATLKETAPINKWVCVSADAVESKAINNYVVFVMASNELVGAIKEAIVE